MSYSKYGLIILIIYLVSMLVVSSLSCNNRSDNEGGSPLAPISAASKKLDSNGQVVMGDVNRDGRVDMGDVSKVERIIMEADPPTKYADLNEDGVIDMRDVTIIERIILEMQ